MRERTFEQSIHRKARYPHDRSRLCHAEPLVEAQLERLPLVRRQCEQGRLQLYGIRIALRRLMAFVKFDKTRCPTGRSRRIDARIARYGQKQRKGLAPFVIRFGTTNEPKKRLLR